MSLDMTAKAPDLSSVSPAEAAVFLDFDGVIVDIAERPDDVAVPTDVLSLLAVIEARTSGAMAIVTGRSIADLQTHLPLVPRSVIGCHGAEWSLPGEPIYRHPFHGSAAVAALQDRAAVARDLPGVFVEPKPVGVVLHFRQSPEQEAPVRALVQAILREHPDFDAMDAKCAVEIRPGDLGKDTAIAQAMGLPAFARRVPVYIGDDVTDEPALAWVARHGGVAIKVGPGDTAAPNRLADPSAVHAALAAWVEAGWDDIRGDDA